MYEQFQVSLKQHIYVFLITEDYAKIKTKYIISTLIFYINKEEI